MKTSIGTGSNPVIETSPSANASALRSSVHNNFFFFFFKLQAKTSAGLGESSAPVMLTTQVRASAAGGGNPDANPHVDQHLGVVIGLAIGVAFTLITALFLLWRSRCIKSLHQEGVDGVSALQRHRNGSGGGVGGVGGVGGGVGVVPNGNGFLKPGNLGLKVRNASGNAAGMLPVLSNGDLGGVGGGGGMVEMDVFVPMLSTIPVDDAPHLDTKVFIFNLTQLTAR